MDEEEILTEYEGEWYLSLPGATEADLTEELLKSMLPGEVLATLSNGEEINLPLTWDLSSYPDQPTGAEMPAEMESLDEAEQPTEDGAGDAAAGAEKIYRFDAAVEGDYSLAEDVLSPYVLFVFGGAELYAADQTDLSADISHKSDKPHFLRSVPYLLSDTSCPFLDK